MVVLANNGGGCASNGGDAAPGLQWLQVHGVLFSACRAATGGIDPALVSMLTGLYDACLALAPLPQRWCVVVDHGFVFHVCRCAPESTWSHPITRTRNAARGVAATNCPNPGDTASVRMAVARVTLLHDPYRARHHPHNSASGYRTAYVGDGCALGCSQHGAGSLMHCGFTQWLAPAGGAGECADAAASWLARTAEEAAGAAVEPFLLVVNLTSTWRTVAATPRLWNTTTLSVADTAGMITGA